MFASLSVDYLICSYTNHSPWLLVQWERLPWFPSSLLCWVNKKQYLTLVSVFDEM